MDVLYDKIIESFEYYYGKFISYILSDIPAVLIPLQRFAGIAPYSNLFQPLHVEKYTCQTTIEEINEIEHSSVCKWILALDFLWNQNSQQSYIDSSKSLCVDILGLDGNWEFLVKGCRLFSQLKNGSANIASDIIKVVNFFGKPQNLYQFLNKPTITLFYDMVFNQLTYPLNSNIDCCESYKYCEKNRYVYKSHCLDECRYLYEWLPAIHQIENAMQNKSRQYIFRFVLDGLVKQRLNYNNEFFSRLSYFKG